MEASSKIIGTSTGLAPETNVNVYIQNNSPVGQLNANRGLIKLILLSVVTLGIYAIVFYCVLSRDINIMASRYDGKKTMHFALMLFIIGPITLGIGYLVWYHNLSNRIGSELNRRGLNYAFNAKTFWLWCVLGAFILVGPFIYLYKICKAFNMIAEHYNING